MRCSNRIRNTCRLLNFAFAGLTEFRQPADARSVSGVVLGLPTVHECGLDGIPVAGALRVLEEGGTELVLPLFGRHHGEVPRDCGLVRILIFNSGLHQRIVGLDIAEGLERSGEAHGAGQGLDAGLAGDDPLQEVLGGFLSASEAWS